MENEKHIGPKLATMTLHVGVKAHISSPNLNDPIRPIISEVLTFVQTSVESIYSLPQQLFNNDPPILRVISSLGEGAESLVVNEALELGYNLQCPIPFEKEEYEKDFEKESLWVYRSLLQKASSVLELDGKRQTNVDKGFCEAYLVAGKVLLSQSDILITVLDGQYVGGKGSLGQIISEAVRLEIPVIEIHANKLDTDSCIEIKGGDRTKAWKENLHYELMKLLRHSNAEDPSTFEEETVLLKKLARRFKKVTKRLTRFANKTIVERYFDETQPSCNIGFPFKIFRDFVAHGKLRLPERIKNFEDDTEQEWKEEWNISGFTENIINQIDNSYRSHYAWADKLAEYYANLYRSSFITNYLFGAIAVLLALFAYATGWSEESSAYHSYQIVPLIFEIFLILVIIGVFIWGNLGRWHQRWIDYRLLAEQLRQMRYLALLGRVVPSVHTPAHHQKHDPRNTWVHVHFRTLVREAGLINAKIDDFYNGCFYNLLMETGLKGQIKYHNDNRSRNKTIKHRLHFLSLILFIATLISCTVKLGLELKHIEPSHWLTFFSATLPAFGSAFAGILFQGEFERLAQRSDAMHDRLESMAQKLNSQRPELSSRDLGKVTEAAAAVMITEVSDWRVVLQNRPLELT